MPANQSQRPKFYEEQYLGAADLTAAVDYGRTQNARHALGAHTWGIAIGLQLKETPQAGGVSVHLLPGYAWDGYGRPIVVLAPHKIAEEMFSAIKFDAAIDAAGKGRLIPVWLRYDETATQRPRPGFEVCGSVDQFSRIQETFRIEIGEQPPADRYSQITVGAKTLPDAKTALQVFDPAAPLVYDESIPQQTFPDPEDRPKWLIPIGYVRWLPVSAQLGHFVARDDSGAGGAEKDSDKIRRFRTRYIGVVAEEIEAADGVIRLRDRGKDPALAFFRPPTQQEIANSTNDLVWVEGNLRVLGNAKLCAPEGNRLEIGRTSASLPWSPAVPTRPGAFVINQQSQGSSEPGADFALMRDGKKRVTLLDNDTTLSSQNGGSLKFFVNYDEPSGAQEVMTVAGTGRVGIGTTTPNGRLDVANLIRFGMNEGGSGPRVVTFTRDATDEGNAGKIAYKPSWDLGALGIVGAGANGDRRIRMWDHVSIDGNLGIGTIAPTHKLHVVAADAVGLFESTGSQAYLRFVTNEGMNNRVEITNRPGGRLSLWTVGGGDALNVTRDGNVGIGTTAPLSRLDVAGDIHVTGKVFADAFSLNSSDRSLKKDITSLTGALQKLLQLHGVNFFWKEPEQMRNQSGPQTGLIAQDVEKVFPDWVTIAPNGYKALTIRGFEALVIEALRELHDEIEGLKKRLANIGGSQSTERSRKKRAAKEKEHERRD